MIRKILNNKNTTGIVYAPNYWQWFEHHKNHNTLPEEICHCETQLDLIQYLGLDVFSRNVYAKQQEYWFGGICEEYFINDIQKEKVVRKENNNTYYDVKYSMSRGAICEQLIYVFDESTVVQREFLIKDYQNEIDLFEEFVNSRMWRFQKKILDSEQDKVGTDGIVIVGDFHSPLKMLHILLGPVNSVYFLMEHPEPAQRLLQIHEKNQLDAIEETVQGGAKVVMSMDNLDTMFHPPEFVEKYSASFYQKASDICHDHNAKFMIHACGNQKANLSLISSFGVDVLEGVAYPPLGNVSLKEAMELSHENFIITGGISAAEVENLRSRVEIFSYTKQLFSELKPYKNRFVFSASCNTPINTPWETIIYFRDAWLKYKDV